VFFFSPLLKCFHWSILGFVNCPIRMTVNQNLWLKLHNPELLLQGLGQVWEERASGRWEQETLLSLSSAAFNVSATIVQLISLAGLIEFMLLTVIRMEHVDSRVGQDQHLQHRGSGFKSSKRKFLY
jgi:hypothetical protein